MKLYSIKRISEVCLYVLLLTTFLWLNSFNVSAAATVYSVNGSLSASNKTVCYIDESISSTYGFIRYVELMPETYATKVDSEGHAAGFNESTSKVNLSRISTSNTKYAPEYVEYQIQEKKYDIWKDNATVKLTSKHGSNTYHYTATLNKEYTTTDVTSLNYDIVLKNSSNENSPWKLIISNGVIKIKRNSSNNDNNYTLKLEIADKEIFSGVKGKDNAKSGNVGWETDGYTMSTELFTTIHKKTQNAQDDKYDRYYVSKDYKCYCPNKMFNQGTNNTKIKYTEALRAFKDDPNCINPYGNSDSKLANSEYGIGTVLLNTVYDGIRSTVPPKSSTDTTYLGLSYLVGIGKLKANDGNVNNCSLAYAYRFTDGNDINRYRKNENLCKIVSGTPGEKKDGADDYKYKLCSEIDAEGDDDFKAVAKKVKNAVSSTNFDGDSSSSIDYKNYTVDSSGRLVFPLTYNFGKNMNGKLKINYCIEDRVRDGVVVDDENSICRHNKATNELTALNTSYLHNTSVTGSTITINIPANSRFIITFEYVSSPECDAARKLFGLPLGTGKMLKYFDEGITKDLTINKYYSTNTDITDQVKIITENYYENLTDDIKAKISKYNICPTIRNLYDKDHKIRKTYIPNIVPECDQQLLQPEEAEIFYANILNYYETILIIEEAIANMDTGDDDKIETNYCQVDKSKNNLGEPDDSNYIAKKTDIKWGTYWGAVCTEKLYVIEFDSPKEIRTGGSFDYKTRLSVVKNCVPIQIKKVSKKPKCSYAVECYGGGHSGGSGAGPNEDFDLCVNECDNGKYTQKCINKCYKKVYGIDAEDVSLSNNDNSVNKNSLLLTQSVSEKYNQLSKIATTYGKTQKGNTITSACKFNGSAVIKAAGGKDKGESAVESNLDKSGCIFSGAGQNHTFAGIGYEGTEPYWKLKTEHGVNYRYYEACATGEYTDGATVTCVEVMASSDKCSKNPEEQYIIDINNSNQEYQSLIDFMKSNSNVNEDFYIAIDEQVPKSGGGYETKTSIFRYKDITDDNEFKIVKEETSTAYDGVTNRKTKLGFTEPKDLKSETLSKSEALKTSVMSLKSISLFYNDGLTQEEIELKNKIYRRDITLSIGASYLKRFGKIGDTEKKKSITSPDSVIYNITNDNTDTVRDKDASYYGPFFQYFTALNTKNDVNRPNTWDITKGVNSVDSEGNRMYSTNIRVWMSSLGTWGQWSTTAFDPLVECMYGIDPGIIPPPTPNNLIFRPIYLGNVFPGDDNAEDSGDGRGRAPRFNWTGKVNSDGTTTGAALLRGFDKNRLDRSLYYNEDVNPEKLTEIIQKKNETIYDESTGEIEYSFRLTPKNISDIRKYNVGKTYLDYSLTCDSSKNNKDNDRGFAGCISSVVSNYVTYNDSSYTADKRWQIASCNNAKDNGSTCDTSINEELTGGS